MSENKETTESKLESSQQHAKQAWESTKKAAKTISEVGKEQVTSAYRESKEHVTAAAQDLGYVAGDKFDQLRGHVQQSLSDAGTRVRTFQDDTESYIRENPLRAVGIAAGVGFIVGLLIRR